jgi:DNA-binding MarR family transcriptional regulator
MAMLKGAKPHPPVHDPHHEVFLSIQRASNVLAAVGYELYHRFDLTAAQFNVMLLIKYREHELTQSDLGKRLVVTRASITSVLDKLESKGLVVRRKVAGNRRIHHVRLTPEGELVLREVEPVYRETARQALEPLSASQHTDLCAMLDMISEHVSGSAGV